MFGLNLGATSSSASGAVFEFGNALSFDGVNDYVSIGSPVSMSSEATVNMWVKFSDLNTRIISDTSNTAVIWTPTSTSVRVYCGGNFQDFVVPSMSLGTWYMLTATRDAANGWRVYLNGTESTSGLQVRSGTFNVNRLGNLGTTYSDIVLDEVSILDGTTASNIQIASLYNSGNGANANTVLGSTSLYYRLNGSGTDTTAIDDSGNSNTGTLVNFTGTYWVEHSNYDTDAENYFNAVSTAGGTLSGTFKTNYNTMILTLKSDGVYSKLLRFNPNAGGTEASAEVDQIIPTTNNINFVNSPTIDTEIGVDFNGTNQYADMNFVPSGLFVSPTDYQFGVTVLTAPANLLGYIMGVSSLSTKRMLARLDGYVRGLDTGISTNTTTTTISGTNLSWSRSAINRIDAFYNGISEGNNTSTDTGGLPVSNFYYGCINNNGTPASFSEGKYTFPWIAQGMTAADMLNLNNRISTFISSL